MALYYDIRVDVSADKILDSGFHFTQGDSQQIFFRIAVMNGQSKFDGSDAESVTINFKKPDYSFVEGTPTLVEDVYQYQILGNELQAVGKVICDLKFFYPSGRVSTGMFSFFVDSDTSSDDVVKSSSYIESLAEAKNTADDIIASISQSSDEVVALKDASEYYAKISESYAHGSTGEREEEDTDNAYYYSEQTKGYKEEAYEYTQKFKYTHFMYSANADGSGMVAAPVEGVTKYVGVYSGTSITPPTNYTDYVWSRFQGYDGTAYFATFDVVDGELIMTWNVDINTISFSINAYGELEVTT